MAAKIHRIAGRLVLARSDYERRDVDLGRNWRHVEEIVGDPWQLLAALAAGLAGALLAMLAQRVAFALGGFYAGGYLALLVAQPIQPDGNQIVWLVVFGNVGTHLR